MGLAHSKCWRKLSHCYHDHWRTWLWPLAGSKHWERWRLYFMANSSWCPVLHRCSINTFEWMQYIALVNKYISSHRNAELYKWLWSQQTGTSPQLLRGKIQQQWHRVDCFISQQVYKHDHFSERGKRTTPQQRPWGRDKDRDRERFDPEVMWSQTSDGLLGGMSTLVARVGGLRTVTFQRQPAQSRLIGLCWQPQCGPWSE